jgi:predicted Zn-dependent protease
MHTLRHLLHRALGAFLLVGLTTSVVEAQQNLTSTDNMMSVQQLRDITDQVLADRVRRFGRDTDPARRADIGGIINAVQRTVGYDAHPLKWEIVMDSSLNAAAIPGGGMIIHVGLALYCDQYGARKAPNDATAKRRAYMGCMAAVIGHEFGHLELGHTENVSRTVARRQEMSRRLRQAQSISAVVRDSVLMAATRFERDQELEADRAGAVYILRIGYEVQDAIDLFDSMDRDERGARNFRHQITWTGGHPRAAERVAMLEVARGQLKLLQRDYDDAIALIEAGELPDTALAMIDRVLAAFPQMAAAQHARAVVLAQQWLAGSDPADLQLRPMLPAYDARFMGAIRGNNPSQGMAARRPAKEAFTALFTRDAHPYTLSNLAVIEAYDGESAPALEKANLAATRAPRDQAVLNNLGVVHFIAGRNTEARDAFVRAEQAAGAQVSAQVLFNLARVSLAMGDREAATRYVNRYLQKDQRSNWSREAQEIARVAGGGAPGARPATTTTSQPSAAASPMPAMNGAELGASRSRIVAALGEPNGGQDAAGNVWRYPARGLAIVLDEEGNAKMFVIESRAGGALGGVTVGDSWDAVRRMHGAPGLEQQTSQGIMYKWDKGAWSLLVVVNNNAVVGVGAGRN